MILKPIDTSSPFYPLPADYESLTVKGQREARVNACSLWLLPTSDPLEKARLRCDSHAFFDRYYLHPDPEAGFDPLFYDEVPCETPDFAWDMLGMWALGRSNVSICPRGSGKTKLNARDMIHCVLTRPAYSFTYATNSHDNAKGTGQSCRNQLYFNERIFNDFSGHPMFGGQIKPTRGDSPTGIELFYLNNDSWIRFISSESTKQRGQRPFRFKLDDPEYEGRESTDRSVLRRYCRRLIIDVVLPMVMREGTGVDWTATFVSRQHFAWHAMLTDMTPDGPRARDPRFEFWNRMIVRAEVEDPVTHERRSCWPSMWPLTRAIQKSTPSLSGKISLEEIRERLGTAVYSKEYMAKPGESDTAHFPDLISDSSRARYGWTIDGVDQAFTTNPRSSGATIGWQRGTPEAPSRVEMPLAQFLRESYLFLTADTSDTANHDSDWKACACMAYLPTHNELFLLDVWGKVARETALVKAIFQMADRWKVPAIYPEKEKGSVGLITTLQSIVQTRATTQMGVTHLPVIRPIPPGTDSKVTRIDNALTMRFEHGLIKFPFWAQGPQWQALYDQIVGFNPNAEDGGLEHDDLLDCVAMHDKPVKGFRRVPTENTGGSTNAIELLLKGRTTINHVPIGMGMNWDLVSPEDVHRLLTPIPTPMSDPDEPYAGTRV